jgi:hypothetical protein
MIGLAQCDLEGHFHEIVNEIFALYCSSDQNYGPPTHFNFLKSLLEQLRFFKFEVLTCKMSAPGISVRLKIIA